MFFGISLCSGLVQADPFADLVQPIFASHCIQCHGKDDKVKGKVNLLDLTSMADLQDDSELLETLIDVIDLQEMPPEDEPQLDDNQRAELTKVLEEMLAQADKPWPQAPIRRMNRFQYNNAVIDLFDLKVVVFALPERMMREHGNYFKPETGKMPETLKVGSRPLGKSQLIEPRLSGVGPFPQDLRAEHGYDNRGDHLSLSTMLLESFLTLSQSVVESRDFNAKTVGIWKSFFAEPAVSKEAPKEKSREQVEAHLRPFLRRAFRRALSEDVLTRYTDFVLSDLKSGTAWTESMRQVAAAALASPRFLYLYDAAAPGSDTKAELTDHDLASRLSFLLWGSIPDDPLLDLADAGKLSDPAELDKQVSRMLLDRRSKRFCDSFPSQWLQLERLISSVPDPEHFKEFYFNKRYRISMYSMMEPLLLFETVYVENRSILEFIDSDYSYRSEHLNRVYQKAGNYGGNPAVGTFKRTPLTNRREGGLITTAATMTMTSGPEHSNPIARGAWLLTVFFNDPPAPPPADVPTLEEEAPPDEAHMTLRERLSVHRERADCAGCHEKIDPLGFALENFDAVGQWRDGYHNGRDIDMQGTLFRRHDFEDVAGFKDAVLAEKERYARAFCEHVMSFALAREISPADDASLDRITEAVIADDYRLHAVIREIVRSESFRLKSTPKTVP